MKKFLNRISLNLAGIQGNLFLLFAIISLFTQSHDRFWMFMIGSIVFTSAQSIIDELRKLNSKK